MEFFKIIPSEIEGKKDISIEIGKGFGDAMDILKELKCKGMVEKDTYFQKYQTKKYIFNFTTYVRLFLI